MEATQVSDRRMYKQNVINTYSGILLNLKKEKQEHSGTCYNMVEPWGYYAKVNKPVTKGQLLYESTYKKYLE